MYQDINLPDHPTIREIEIFGYPFQIFKKMTEQEPDYDYEDNYEDEP